MSYPPNDPQQPWQHGNAQNNNPQQPYGQPQQQPEQPPQAQQQPPYGQPQQPQQPYGQPQPPQQQPPQQQQPQQQPPFGQQPQQQPSAAPNPYPQTPGQQQPTGPQQPYTPQQDYGSQQTQVYPPQNSGAYPAGGGEPPRKKKSKAGWIAGGSVVLLVIIAGVVGISIGNSTHAPQNQVTAYLDLLKAGKAEQALKESGVKVEKGDVLLTDDAYKSADDRISKYSISSTEVEGDSASVTASISQGGETYDQTFSLSKAGKDLVFFDKWKLDAPDLGEVSYDVTGPQNAQVAVNGVAVPGDGDALRALPGTYKIAMADDQTVFQADGVSATILGFGNESEETPELAVGLSDDGVTAAQDAVTAYLDECEASTEVKPENCANWVNDDGTDKIEDVVWTFDPRPEFSIGEYDGSGWAVSTDTEGKFTLDCTVVVDGKKQTHVGMEAGAIPFSVDGTVTFGKDGKATFEWDQL